MSAGPVSGKRSGRGVRLMSPVILAIVLIAAGIYYVDEYHEDMERTRYPLEHREELIAAAEEFDLEPWHVAAVVFCESEFHPDAVSRVGARGLMQIMPDTGEWIAEKMGEESGYSGSLLFEPETNLRYGCWYLDWLMNRYNQDMVLTTAAFHSGPGRVDKWLKDPEISPDGTALPIGNIPSDETRWYVNRVLTMCDKYRTLYNFDEAGGDA